MPYPDWDQIKQDIPGGAKIPMIRAGTPTFMRLPLARTRADLKGADVVIIGSAYVAGRRETLWGVDKRDWAAAAERVRQQSARYPSGYIQDFDLDVFEHLRVVDYGDAELDPQTQETKTYDTVIRAQRAVEAKVNDALDADAVPIVISQNSPCGSYAIAKPIAERTQGEVGVISLDTHWDIDALDQDTMDPRIAGAASWKAKMYEFQENIPISKLVEIGERGMGEDPERVRHFLMNGAHFYPMWKVREMGIEALCRELRHAYQGTRAVYAHFDMDILGGAGPAPGDILGDLAEPIGMTDYEVIRLAHEIGKRGFDGLSFICIPPGSEVIYRTIVYVIMYMLAGKIHSTSKRAADNAGALKGTGAHDS
jgi:agmatinase